MGNKQQAQHRADQIQVFNQELSRLQSEGVLTLSDTQKHAINSHHNRLLDVWAQQFEIDVSNTDKRLSLGMRIAAFFGALAFAASIFFLFYQFWGLFRPLTQSFVLLMAPLVGLGLTYYLAIKENSGYFAKIAGLMTVVTFVLNLSMLGQIYNLAPSPNAFLLWTILALGLSYLIFSRVLLALAILFFTCFLSAKVGTFLGVYWSSFAERPENFFLPALLVTAAGTIQLRGYENFAAVYRVLGSLLILLPVLLLSHWGGGSYLTLHNESIEMFYQVLGFVFSALLIWVGIKQSWRDLINTGTVFFTLFLYSKLFDWWWEWFPKYLFFLVIGLISILVVVIFKRLKVSANKTGRERAKNG